MPSDLADLKLTCKPQPRADYEVALAYRESNIPRRIRDPVAEHKAFQSTGKHQWKWRRAGWNEAGGEKYSLLTSTDEIGAAFGLGLGLYLKQLLWLSMAMLAWGVINILSARYFNGADYSNHQEGLQRWFLKGTATCTDILNAVVDDTDVEVFNCPIATDAGYADLGGVIIMTTMAVVSSVWTGRESKELDESIQTAQDYSLVVNDPGPDADDPDEWGRYFEEWGQVAYVTIAKSNGHLLEKLVARREVVNFMNRSNMRASPKDIKAVADARRAPGIVKRFLQRFGLRRGRDYWVAKLLQVTAEINDMLMLEKFPVCKVYITFMEELGQRKALKELNSGLIPSLLDATTTQGIDRDLRFRGENTLHVSETVEPSEVIWQNLDYTLSFRLLQQGVTTILTGGLVYAAYEGLRHFRREDGHVSAALVVSGISFILPVTLQIITSIEKHVHVSERELSCVWKLVAARVLTTAVLIFISTDWDNWLREDTLAEVQTLLITDAFLSPAIRLLSIPYHIRRYMAAHHSKSQSQANMLMEGSLYSLAERYTAMIKTVYLAIFFAAVVPTGLFITALALLVTFCTDKYLLLRQWAQGPMLDDRLARRVPSQLMFAIMVHVVLTSYMYYAWPFDGVAPSPTQEGAFVKVSSWPQSWWDRSGWWMNDEQVLLASIYLWISTCLVLVFASVHLAYWLKHVRRVLWLGQYQAGTVQSSPDLSLLRVGKLEAFVPMFVQNGYASNFIACELDQVWPDHYPAVVGGTVKTMNLADDIPKAYRRAALGSISWRGGKIRRSKATGHAGHVEEGGACFSPEMSTKVALAKVVNCVADMARLHGKGSVERMLQTTGTGTGCSKGVSASSFTQMVRRCGIGPDSVHRDLLPGVLSLIQAKTKSDHDTNPATTPLEGAKLIGRCIQLAKEVRLPSIVMATRRGLGPLGHTPGPPDPDSSDESSSQGSNSDDCSMSPLKRGRRSRRQEKDMLVHTASAKDVWATSGRSERSERFGAGENPIAAFNRGFFAGPKDQAQAAQVLQDSYPSIPAPAAAPVELSFFQPSGMPRPPTLDLERKGQHHKKQPSNSLRVHPGAPTEAVAKCKSVSNEVASVAPESKGVHIAMMDEDVGYSCQLCRRL
ncbi:unnamed protein product [Chrysoparadoxa australica]